MYWLRDGKIERVEAVNPPRDEILRMKRAAAAPLNYQKPCTVKILKTGEIVEARLADLVPATDQPPAKTS